MPLLSPLTLPPPLHVETVDRFDSVLRGFARKPSCDGCDNCVGRTDAAWRWPRRCRTVMMPSNWLARSSCAVALHAARADSNAGRRELSTRSAAWPPAEGAKKTCAKASWAEGRAFALRCSNALAKPTASGESAESTGWKSTRASLLRTLHLAWYGD